MKTILFDIDRILLDNDRWNEIRYTNLATQLKVDRSEIVRVSKEYKEGLSSMTAFTPWDYAEFTGNILNKDVNLIEEIYGAKEPIAESIFPDVIPTLDRLKTEYKFGIYSAAASVEFQLLKLKAMNILDYFESDLIFISEDKRTQKYLENIPENSIIVDDNLETVLDIISFAPSLRPILLDRRNQYLDQNCERITSLTDLLQS